MSASYATIYRNAREVLEKEAEQRLNRPLTTHERNLFRNCGTLTMLESLGMTVYFAENAEDLTAKLAATSMSSRFNLALDELVQRLNKSLGRPLTAAEHEWLRTLGNIEELWQVEQHIQAPSPAERAAAFANLCKQPWRK